MAVACDSAREIPELGVDDRVVCCAHEDGVGFGGARGRGLEVVRRRVYGVGAERKTYPRKSAVDEPAIV
jgi:hypothetical protein